jgi:hypothetical protein
MKRFYNRHDDLNISVVVDFAVVGVDIRIKKKAKRTEEWEAKREREERKKIPGQEEPKKSPLKAALFSLGLVWGNGLFSLGVCS